MTEKRYKAIYEIASYKDTVTGEILSPKFEEDFYKVLDLLNENEELRQFKQLVFNSIDKSLKEDKHYYEMTYEDYLNGRIEALEELKQVIWNDWKKIK